MTLDNRHISNKYNNPDNQRSKKDLLKRDINDYNDETVFEVIGFGKLIYHPEKLVKLKKDESSFPLTATLSLGNYCNHGCLWCSTAFFRESDATSIDYNKITNWLKKAKLKGLKGVGYVGNGEPLAYKRFKELSKMVNDNGLSQGVFTNGYLIDRFEEELLSNFTYIRISLDAGSSKIHSELHDVPDHHFDKILKNVKNIIKKRKNKSPTIGFQFATHDRNISDVEKCIIIAKDLGVDYVNIKPVFDRGSVGDKIKKNTLTPKDFDDLYSKIAKYSSKEFKIYYRPHQIYSEHSSQNMLAYNRCFAPMFGVNIYEDGKIVGCGPHHVVVGDLETDLEKLEQNIRDASKNFDLVKCPAGCRYHAMNFLLHKVLNSDDYAESDHINLI